MLLSASRCAFIFRPGFSNSCRNLVMCHEGSSSVPQISAIRAQKYPQQQTLSRLDHFQHISDHYSLIYPFTDLLIFGSDLPKGIKSFRSLMKISSSYSRWTGFNVCNFILDGSDYEKSLFLSLTVINMCTAVLQWSCTYGWVSESWLYAGLLYEEFNKKK